MERVELPSEVERTLNEDYEDAAEEAVIESSEEEQSPAPRNWLLWAGLGLIGLGLLLRLLWRRK